MARLDLKKKLLLDSIRSLRGPFTVAEVCDRSKEICPYRSLTRSEALRLIGSVPDIRPAGRTLVYYPTSSGYVNLYTIGRKGVDD